MAVYMTCLHCAVARKIIKKEQLGLMKIYCSSLLSSYTIIKVFVVLNALVLRIPNSPIDCDKRLKPEQTSVKAVGVTRISCGRHFQIFKNAHKTNYSTNCKRVGCCAN